MLVVALPKGRLIKECVDLFSKVYNTDIAVNEESRKLMFDFADLGLKFLIVKPVDIPTYVETGAADIGIVGKDILMEQERDIYEPLDLKFGYCRLVVAEKEESRGDTVKNWSKVRIATKYPNITASHFSKKGIPVELIKLYGSVELAPLINLASKIVDLVSTGATLKQNRLVEKETIMEATARLVLNRASHKMQFKQISEMLEKMAASL